MIVEAMKLESCSFFCRWCKKIMVNDGQPVEFGQTLSFLD